MTAGTARIAVPSWPAFEPSARHGAFALVGDDVWLSAPRGVVVRALPSLERVREFELPERVDGLAVSADGRVLAVRSDEGNARRITLRDARTLALRSTIDGDDVIAAGVALSATGMYLALTSPTRSRVWRLDELGAPVAPARRVDGLVAFAPDERRAAIGTPRHLARIELDDPLDLPFELLRTGWFVDALAWLGDGSLVAAAFRMHRGGETCVAGLELAHDGLGFAVHLDDPTDDVTGLAFSPSGALAIQRRAGRILEESSLTRCGFEGRDGAVAWWGERAIVAGKARPIVVDAASGRTIAAYPSAPGDHVWVHDVAFGPGVLATWTRRDALREARAWDVATGEELDPRFARAAGQRDAAALPDGRSRIVRVETGIRPIGMGEDEACEGALALVRDGLVVRRVCEHPGHIENFAVEKDGLWILSVGGGVARVSSIAGEQTRWIAPDLEVQFASFDAEFGGVAALGTRRDDGEEEARLVTLDDAPRAFARGPGVAVAGHARLGLLAVARPDDTIDVVRGTEHLATLTSHRSRILALAMSPCGTRLAVADFDGVVCIHAVP